MIYECDGVGPYGVSKHRSSGVLVILTCAALLGLSRPASGLPPSQASWEVDFRFCDEFEKEKLDSAKWDDHNPKWRGRPPGLNLPANVRVVSGFLSLSAARVDLPVSDLPYKDFGTSAVKSRDKVLYGYFEIRAKPMRSRIVSAFWLYDAGAAHWTEIDVFELAPGKPGFERRYNMNVHLFRFPGYEGTIEKHQKFPEVWTAPWNLADDFHVYGLEWDPRRVRWYVDDQLVRELPNEHLHFPLHINFDTETMPEWLGLPEPGELPAEFLIDYIRVWKKVEKSPAATEAAAQ